ncbi:MAG: CapA family protein [Rhodobacteraceae bacterium]|nr:CapA family protein [Paracoccaceae bacterium]
MKIVAFGQALIRHRVRWPEELRDLVAGAGAVICNFEGCIRPAGSWPMKTGTVHPAHPQALAALRALGVTHLALANNHLWDFGPESVLATRRAALAAGFAVAGAGADLAEAAAAGHRGGVALVAADTGPTPDWAIARPDHPGINPLRLRLCLRLPAADIARLTAISVQTGAEALARRRQAVGYDAPVEGASFYGLHLAEAAAVAEDWQADPEDLHRLTAAVAAARAGADRVLVSLHYHHWRSDWRESPSWLRAAAAAIAAAGADALFAHGPPVASDLALVGGMPVAPGLGNLVFHTARSALYARQGIDVWTGAALVLDRAGARQERVRALGPDDDPGPGGQA